MSGSYTKACSSFYCLRAMKPISPKVYGVLDYATGAFFALVPSWFNLHGACATTYGLPVNFKIR